MNLSTCKFFKERKREREGEKRPEQKTGVCSQAGSIVWDFFQEVLPIPSVGCGQRHRQRSPRSAGQTWGEAGGRRCGGAGAQQRLFRPGAPRLRPLPHPGLSLLPPPPNPYPALSGARPATRAHSFALPLAHTHGRLAAKFRLRSPLPDPAAVLAAVTLNFPSSVTHSPCFPHCPASCAPLPAFFFFFFKAFHHLSLPQSNPHRALAHPNPPTTTTTTAKQKTNPLNWASSSLHRQRPRRVRPARTDRKRVKSVDWISPREI